MEFFLLFGVFLMLLLAGVPVAFCLGLSAMAVLFYLDIPILVAFQRMATGMNLFALMAIPFFIFAGELMNQAGIAEKLLKLAQASFGRVRGGLGLVSVSSSMMFGAVSGSAVASASAMGSALMPLMKREGYDSDYAVNVTATASTTGLLIPPSHNMIIYSVAAGGGVSIGSLFLAGIVPGILLGLALMAIAYGVAMRRGYPAGQFPGWLTIMTHFVTAIPGLLTAGIILGGVLSGVFTATESSAIAVIYTMFVAFFVYRSLSIAAFINASINAVKTTSLVMIVIGTAVAFGWVMAVLQAPQHIATLLIGVSDNPLVILLLINIALLVLGTFMDMSPLIVITTPIFLPVVSEFGVDPVQFGIMLILNLGMGLVTPPVGSVLFVSCAVGKMKIEDTVKSIWPYYLAFLLVLILVTYVSQATLYLPEVFGT